VRPSPERGSSTRDCGSRTTLVAPTGPCMQSRKRVSLGARAARPQVGRRPTGELKRARCPRSQGRHRAEGFLGARAIRPQVGRRPTGELKRASCPRSRGRHRAEGFLGARAARPQVGRRPTGELKRARCPRSRGRHRAEGFLGARAARPQVGRRPTGELKRASRPRSRASLPPHGGGGGCRGPGKGPFAAQNHFHAFGVAGFSLRGGRFQPSGWPVSCLRGRRFHALGGASTGP